MTDTRRLGRHGPVVSAIGLGGVAAANGYGRVADTTLEALVRWALDLGITLFDTAEYYGGGRGEVVLGRALRGRRDEAVISTKYGMRRDITGGPYIQCDPAYVKAACDASLARLGVEAIDLYHMARLDPAVPIEETVGAMAELVAQGKVRHLGLCEVSAATLRRAAAVYPITAVQTEYSLFERHVEASILPACRELGIGFIAYCPLSRGLLTGQFAHGTDHLVGDDWRRKMYRFMGDAFGHNRALAAAVGEHARARNLTAAQLALAWLLAAEPSLVPIPGTTRFDHLEEDARSADVGLSAEEFAAIAALVPTGAADGLRYPESLMAGIDRDDR
ncbi:MAG TPA: aldo/keto reductase [Acidimicrobiales bacterium]|nr:aldo/keto reductase [Acidimicrobiales bacterium]